MSDTHQPSVGSPGITPGFLLTASKICPFRLPFSSGLEADFLGLLRTDCINWRRSADDIEEFHVFRTIIYNFPSFQLFR
ncbi:MAG: hypothetical protein ACXACI_10095 [Candidatus Hodarchaeales archaeon]